MPDWPTVALPEVLDFREGPGILAKDFREDGVPLIRLAGVKYGARILDGCNFLDPAMVMKKWNHFRLELGDVLLSTSASLGEVAVVGSDGVGALPYTGLIRFRPADDRVSARFIRIALTSRSFKNQIEAMGAGSVLRHFGPMHLRKMHLEVPPLPVQNDIADVIEAIDDKIESNRRVLRVAARLLDAIVAAAPSSVPLVELSALAEARRETVNPADLSDDLVDHFSLPAFDAGAWPERVAASSIMSSKLAVRAPTVLVSRLNPRINRTWHAVPESGVQALASTEFSCLVPIAGSSLAGIWLAVRDEYFMQELIQRASGTSGSHQRIRGDDLLAIQVPDTRKLPEALLENARAVLQLASARRHETQALAEARDALLPDLLSGRLRVGDSSDADKATT